MNSLIERRGQTKPRVRFCWDCGRQLYGNHHVETEIDGHKRILHKSCAKALFHANGPKTRFQNAGVEEISDNTTPETKPRCSAIKVFIKYKEGLMVNVRKPLTGDER